MEKEAFYNQISYLKEKLENLKSKNEIIEYIQQQQQKYYLIYTKQGWSFVNKENILPDKSKFKDNLFLDQDIHITWYFHILHNIISFLNNQVYDTSTENWRDMLIRVKMEEYENIIKEIQNILNNNISKLSDNMKNLTTD